MVKRYFISSVQALASPHSLLLNGIEQYAKVNNAEIILLPMIGNSAKQDWDKVNYLLKSKYTFEYGERTLNSNIKIEQFHVRPYQIDPVVGLQRFAQRGTTIVFASPKQRLKTVSHSNLKHPKFLVTTGAVTRPNYATGKDVSAERRRLGNIARRDHVYGGLIVEIEDDKYFHMRHIKADTCGKFVDLGVMYDGDERKNSVLEAMVLGDYHNGNTDTLIREVTYEMIKKYNPKRLILHDFFDAHSISHHIDKKFIEQKIIQQLDKNHFNLKLELEESFDELNVLLNLFEGDIYMLTSNHHEFLNRYLNKGRFMKDAINARVGFELAYYMAKKDYNDPVYEGIKRYGYKKTKERLSKRVRLVKRDADLKIRGYQLGVHGDKGPGYGYSSMNSKENDFGKSISGHTHKAQILRETYTVGTMLPLNMFYMRGQPSDWSHTHAFLWGNGTVQLVHINNGKWMI